ncbi:Rho guanine nucleotide exchange factor 4 [Balamuthia mandrillaris]
MGQTDSKPTDVQVSDIIASKLGQPLHVVYTHHTVAHALQVLEQSGRGAVPVVTTTKSSSTSGTRLTRAMKGGRQEDADATTTVHYKEEGQVMALLSSFDLLSGLLSAEAEDGKSGVTTDNSARQQRRLRFLQQNISTLLSSSAFSSAAALDSLSVIKADAPLQEALAAFAEQSDIPHHLLIVDDNNQLIYTLSQADMNDYFAQDTEVLGSLAEQTPKDFVANLLPKTSSSSSSSTTAGGAGTGVGETDAIKLSESALTAFQHMQQRKVGGVALVNDKSAAYEDDLDVSDLTDLLLSFVLSSASNTDSQQETANTKVEGASEQETRKSEREEAEEMELRFARLQEPLSSLLPLLQQQRSKRLTSITAAASSGKSNIISRKDQKKAKKEEKKQKKQKKGKKEKESGNDLPQDHIKKSEAHCLTNTNMKKIVHLLSEHRRQRLYVLDKKSKQPIGVVSIGYICYLLFQEENKKNSDHDKVAAELRSMGQDRDDAIEDGDEESQGSVAKTSGSGTIRGGAGTSRVPKSLSTRSSLSSRIAEWENMWAQHSGADDQKDRSLNTATVPPVVLSPSNGSTSTTLPYPLDRENRGNNAQLPPTSPRPGSAPMSRVATARNFFEEMDGGSSSGGGGGSLRPTSPVHRHHATFSSSSSSPYASSPPSPSSSLIQQQQNKQTPATATKTAVSSTTTPTPTPPTTTTNNNNAEGSAPKPATSISRSHPAALSKSNIKERQSRVPDSHKFKEPKWNDNKQSKTLQELIQTEEDYVADLQLVIKLYIGPMHERAEEIGIKSARELECIFSNIVLISKVNEELLTGLRELPFLPFDYRLTTVADLFEELSEYLKMYTLYCSNQANAWTTLKRLRKKSDFNNFLLKREQDTKNNPECRKLTIEDFLIKPMQRICRYPLFLRELMNKATEAEQKKLEAALAHLEQTVQVVNNSKREAENRQKTLDIQAKFSNGHALDLVKPWRRFLLEGSFTSVKGIGEECILLLFTDVLLIAREGRSISGKKLYLRSLVPIESCIVWDMCDKQKKGKTVANAFEIHRTDTKKKFLIVAANKEEKDLWLGSINDCIMQSVASFARKQSAAGAATKLRAEDFVRAAEQASRFTHRDKQQEPQTPREGSPKAEQNGS